MSNYANCKMIKFPQSLTTVTLFSKLLAGILFIVFIIVAFFAGMKYQAMTDFVKIQQSNLITVQPSPTPTNETAGWQTYRNEEYGFEIKYPNEGKILSSYSANDFLYLRLEPDKLDLKINIQLIPSDKSLNEWIREIDDLRKTAYEKTPSVITQRSENILISGYPAIYREELLTAAAFTRLTTYIKKGNSIIEIGLEKINPKAFTSEDKSLYNQILSTFKFIDQNRAGCNTDSDCPNGYICKESSIVFPNQPVKKVCSVNCYKYNYATCPKGCVKLCGSDCPNCADCGSCGDYE